MVSVVRRAACKKLSRAWRACVTLRSAMLRISSGTWKFICPAPWVSPAIVSPPWNGGPSEPIPADPGRSAAAWEERGIVPKRSTVARHCGPDHGRAALAFGEPCACRLRSTDRTRPVHSVVCQGQYGLFQRGHMNDTSADLRSLLDRLKGAQHALIEDAARQPGLPSTAIIRKIAELENVIAAVMALIEERQGSR